MTSNGLAYVLKGIFKLAHFKTDISSLALARLELKFSALMRVNPMARASKAMQIEPKVLTFKPHSLDVGMPDLVTRTGLGPKHIGTPPCAPAGVNHK
jgi:chlorophyllase